jgi:phage tail-like protein
MARLRSADRYRGFKYKVEIPGFDAGIGFSKVSGLKEESEVVEYREGTDPITPHKFPGLVSYDNIVLERGLSSNDDLVTWRRQVLSAMRGANASAEGVPGADIRRPVTIRLYDRDGKEVKQWQVYEAWPAVLEYGDLDANSSDVVLHTMELAHEGFNEVPVGAPA